MIGGSLFERQQPTSLAPSDHFRSTLFAPSGGSRAAEPTLLAAGFALFLSC